MLIKKKETRSKYGALQTEEETGKGDKFSAGYMATWNKIFLYLDVSMWTNTGQRNLSRWEFIRQLEWSSYKPDVKLLFPFLLSSFLYVATKDIDMMAVPLGTILDLWTRTHSEDSRLSTGGWLDSLNFEKLYYHTNHGLPSSRFLYEI